MKKNALIILERPWGLSDNDQNVSSVLPFFQGLERLNGNFDLYHSNFYEKNSFVMALDELTQMDYDNYFVYIACHGSGLRLQNMNLTTALNAIYSKSQSRNIVGVILGSCLVGNNISHLEVYSESSSITWKIGYKCNVDWLEGTLLDLKLFTHMMLLEEGYLYDKEEIINTLKSALYTYDPRASIGIDAKGEDISLSDSLTTIIQPKGKGNRAKDYSALLFEQKELTLKDC